MSKELKLPKKPVKVLTEPNKMLRRKCKEINFWDEDFFTKLLIIMKETMLEHKGVGLAGNQIGYPYRVIILYVPYHRANQLLYLANPEIIEISKEEISLEEGCLSCPDERIKVPRAREIEIKACDPRWGKEKIYNFRDAASIVAQHEIDHLNGKLIIDYRG
jgi:peptide deformylase